MANVFSPRQILISLLVVVFGACSVAASDANVLRDSLGAGGNVQEAQLLLDGDNFGSPGARRVLLAGKKGGHSKGGHSKGGHSKGGHSKGGHSKGGHKSKGGHSNKGGHSKKKGYGR